MFSNLFGKGAGKLGEGLAEELKPASTRQGRQPEAVELRNLLQRVDAEVRPMKLGWLGRARLANAFKWKLQELGFTPAVADELTQTVLVHLLRPAPAAPKAPIKPNRAMRRRMAAKRR